MLFYYFMKNLGQNRFYYNQIKKLKLEINSFEEYKMLFSFDEEDARLSVSMVNGKSTLTTSNKEFIVDKKDTGKDFLKKLYPIFKNNNLNLEENMLETLYDFFETGNEDDSKKRWKKKRRFIPSDRFLLTLPPELFWKEIFDRVKFSKLSMMNKFRFILFFYIAKKYYKEETSEIGFHAEVLNWDKVSLRNSIYSFKEMKRVLSLINLTPDTFFSMNFKSFSVLPDEHILRFNKYLDSNLDFSLFGLTDLNDYDLQALKSRTMNNFCNDRAFNFYSNRAEENRIKYFAKEDDYDIEILEKSNPLGLYLGYIVSCCQKFGDAAESCIRAGYEYDNYSFLTVRKKGKLIAHSLIILKDNYIFIDSIESFTARGLEVPYKRFISDMRKIYDRVLLGGHTTSSFPPDFVIDKIKPGFKEQVILRSLLENKTVYTDIKSGLYDVISFTELPKSEPKNNDEIIEDNNSERTYSFPSTSNTYYSRGRGAIVRKRRVARHNIPLHERMREAQAQADAEARYIQIIEQRNNGNRRRGGITF